LDFKTGFFAESCLEKANPSRRKSQETQTTRFLYSFAKIGPYKELKQLEAFSIYAKQLPCTA
jgi:hypothetical protein